MLLIPGSQFVAAIGIGPRFLRRTVSIRAVAVIRHARAGDGLPRGYIGHKAGHGQVWLIPGAQPGVDPDAQQHQHRQNHERHSNPRSPGMIILSDFPQPERQPARQKTEHQPQRRAALKVLQLSGKDRLQARYRGIHDPDVVRGLRGAITLRNGVCDFSRLVWFLAEDADVKQGAASYRAHVQPLLQQGEGFITPELPARPLARAPALIQLQTFDHRIQNPLRLKHRQFGFDEARVQPKRGVGASPGQADPRGAAE